ncbi:MAG TPA: CHAT domain-containing protein [Pyrinomonadaceae bacterium]|jgi:CHAT domain-containing protein
MKAELFRPGSYAFILSTFIFHLSPFTLYRSSFIVYPSSFVLRLSSRAERPALVVLRPSSFVLRLPRFIFRPSRFAFRCNLRARFVVIKACLLLLLLSPVVVVAQAARGDELRVRQCSPAFDVKEAEREFAAAALKHQRQFRGLIQERGVRLPSLDGANFDLQDLTATVGRNYEPETAALFYDEDEAGLRAWLIDGAGIRAFHRAAFAAEQLEMAMTAVRESLDVENLEALRLPPRLRPKRAAAPSRLNAKALLPRRLLSLTNLLMPADIACALLNVRHLIIVPVRDLGTIPFAALRPFDDALSLIDRMSVTIAPSLEDLKGEPRAWSGDFRQPLLVGNPYLSPGAGWEPLPNAEREAQFVARLYRTTPLIGREATREAILSKAATADFLYFATHGAADPAQPLDGGYLVFSGLNGSENVWTAREIQATRLRARLAVLSACQTGLGKIHDAGIIGLARAFQLAGVPRVVMSLWSVYDDATAELMQAFVGNLRALPPAEALRQAMLKVRKRRPDPAEWASFVIFGAPL